MSKRSQSTSLPQAALQLTGVSLLSQFLYFLYQAALSHIVGTEGLGLVHMVLPIYYTLLAFLTSGFALAISKLCSEYQSRTQSRGLTVIVSNTLFLFLVTLLLVALLFWLGLSHVRPTVGWRSCRWAGMCWCCRCCCFYRVGDFQ